MSDIPQVDAGSAHDPWVRVFRSTPMKVILGCALLAAAMFMGAASQGQSSLPSQYSFSVTATDDR